MHIKKFTQFILENEYYVAINEVDIVPGVPYNSAIDRSGKLGNMKDNIMYVNSDEKSTVISFNKGDGSRDVAIHFPSSKPKPSELVAMDKSVYTVYAFISETGGGEKEDYYPSSITKIEDFDANASPGQLFKASNSIDLLADFMVRSGISMDATAGSNLAKVITTLLESPTYKLKVTDTFLKFATKIAGEITIKAFIPRLGAKFGNDKQDPGMQAFVKEFPISRAALSPKKS